MDSVATTLIAALRKLAPHRVLVHDSSGDEPRLVAIPHGRKRWSKVAETIDGMPWVKCELLAKDGAVLGYVENENAVDELEELVPERGAAQQRWFLEMMIKAQSTALTFRDKEHSALLEGMRDLLAVHAQSTRELIELFKVQRDVAAETARLTAAQEGDVGTQIMKMIESSPSLQQMLAPIFMKLLGAGAAPPRAKPKTDPPSNGVKS